MLETAQSVTDVLFVAYPGLDAAVASGLVARDGRGRSRSPYLYWLPGREAEILPT